jgi:hypothetical protein
MKRFGAAILVVTSLIASPASAGVYADDVTRCLVKSSSETDQLALVKWIFAAMAQHPAIRDYASITTTQQAGLNQSMAGIVNRLLLKDCRTEVVSALKYEGAGFLEQSFKALGEVAMGGLMTNDAVEKGLTGWAGQMDVEGLNALAAEAGRTPSPRP